VKPRHAAALETHLLERLVEKIKTLNISLTLGEKILGLKCPCGAIILPPTPAIPNLKEQQRAMLKSKIERHLRDDHGLSKHTIGVVLRECFAPD
jgi:hypothetical protein